MLSKEENELVSSTGPGTPMGELFRRFWQPILLAEELPAPDGPPVRVQALGERPGRLSGHQREDWPPGRPLCPPSHGAVLRAQRGVRPALRLPRLEV